MNSGSQLGPGTRLAIPHAIFFEAKDLGEYKVEINNRQFGPTYCTYHRSPSTYKINLYSHLLLPLWTLDIRITGWYAKPLEGGCRAWFGWLN